jgi:hypothetical protein
MTMAKVRLNALLESIRGQIGEDLVLKRGRDGQIILSRKPTFPEDREFSPAQRAHQARFRAAAAYAKAAARQEPIYAELARKRRQTAYNVALSDWFHPPKIVVVDRTGWTGQAGQEIRVLAEDDVAVRRVEVEILAGNQRLEAGEARPERGPWWVYRTTADCPPVGVRLVVRAEDLPGHVAEVAEKIP